MSIKIFGYNIDTTYPNWPINKCIVINTLNPHSFCVAEKDNAFKQALLSSDILIPDGIGVVMAAKVLKGVKISRIAGADMHMHLLKEAQKNKLKVFYLGSSEKVLKIIKTRINKEYNLINVGTFSPPFKFDFSKEDDLKMIDMVNRFSPDILFVGMTAPKQEKWAYLNKNKLNATIITSIGAVFDFYAGNIKRAPKWMINIGLEWLYRLIKEPRRMWRRYLVNNTKFIYYVIKEKLLNNV